jgi:plastocyanin
MLHYKRQSVLTGLIIVLIGFLAACQATPTLATSSAPGISVGITGDTCPNVVVQVDQQVTWTNQDSREHIVRDKPAEGNGQFDSGTLQPGDSFAFTFPQLGSYSYECSVDGAMTGTVTVQP